MLIACSKIEEALWIVHAHQWRGIRDNGKPCNSVEFDVRWREWCAAGYAQSTKRRLNVSRQCTRSLGTGTDSDAESDSESDSESESDSVSDSESESELQVTPTRRVAPRRASAAPTKIKIVSAERVGFEPTVQFPVHMISSHAPSASRSPLQVFGAFNRDRVTSIDFDSAEREGFEPSVPVRAHLISNQVPSTARTSLRGRIWQRARGLSTSWADIRFEFIGRPFFARNCDSFRSLAYRPSPCGDIIAPCCGATRYPCPWERNWEHEIQKARPYWPFRI